ncbi:P-loop containing nucleoside triphosphate hydrolase protein [Desarmillaria tabescens]|uniref:P-loop containing nucleoside triphosphate hydrolase protein n=1 Tax=Armillaria tabescens TaxID=1929756 RepID=A0AA39K0H0_ARMTA|nr:P-loop containing nucleoside triphosphate hydrolase protein [Desarmillaria tabescens]KAK0451185.1 P-loop containing nucleoside triphosphate hydrolase protein [Desarmillaria tabescens]
MTIPVPTESDLLVTTSAPIPPSHFYGESGSVRRSSRPKTSLFSSVTKMPRKRSASTNLGTDTSMKILKKQKLEEKKANTVLVHEKRVARDIAMGNWLRANRDYFEPLLPSITTFEHYLGPGTSGAPVKFHSLQVQPNDIKGGEMKDYQLHGLSFLVWMYKNGMNCILGDEMGLGKTLQTLSLFAYIKENSSSHDDPHLVICPLSVLSSWEAEAARWLPSMRTVRFHGPSAQRTMIKKTFLENSFDIVLTTYDAFSAEVSWFKSRRWTYCVLDEGHKIKNSGTQVAQNLQSIGSLYRLVLTGTPVQNNLVEVWGLLHFLYPNIFTAKTEQKFLESFDLSKGIYDVPFLGAVQKLLSVIMLRRTKSVVSVDVPPRDETTVFIPLTEAQRFWHYRLLYRIDMVDLEQIFDPQLELDNKTANEGRREVLSHLQNDVNNGTTQDKKLWQRLSFILMQLRMLCDHPYLLPDAQPDPYTKGEHIVASSSKMIAIDKILADVLPKGERVIIFSQWTGMLDLLEDFMVLRNIRFARLDGSTTRPRRNLDIKLFQREKSPYQVFLISTQAGGLGINLTKAQNVIMCDSSWNPQNDLQAIARAHRIGQTKTVKVYRLICRGSVEDQMLDRLRRKLFLSLKIMDGDSSSSENPSLGLTELKDILRKGSSALSSSDDHMNLGRFLDASLSDILGASRAREDARDAKMKQNAGKDDSAIAKDLVLSAEEEERQLLSGIAQVKCRLFEGNIVEKAKHVEDIVPKLSTQKRARNDNTVTISGMTFIVDGPSPEDIQERAQQRQRDIMEVKKAKKKKRQWENEDWCVHCREGGELVTCDHCPRVFHAECYGISQREANKRAFLVCKQHSCCECSRSTAQSGGMLYRCRTCPRAFCEDCLPDEINDVGDVLPEYQLLNYGQTPTAFYIQCHFCDIQAKEDPTWWSEWQVEIAKAEKEVNKSLGK